MRTWRVAVARVATRIGEDGGSRTRRVLEGAAEMNQRCRYYSMSAAGDCVPPHSAVVYFVTGVAGMAFILTLTLFFICCLCWRKRQRDRAEAAFRRQQAQAQALAMHYPGTNPLFFQSQVPEMDPRPRDDDVAMVPVEGKSPSVCVIMAGEEKPTYLAHPVESGSDLPTSHQPLEAHSTHQASKPSS